MCTGDVKNNTSIATKFDIFLSIFPPFIVSNFFVEFSSVHFVESNKYQNKTNKNVKSNQNKIKNSKINKQSNQIKSTTNTTYYFTDPAPSERGRTISRISVAKGSNLNFRGRKSNSLMNLCGKDCVPQQISKI